MCSVGGELWWPVYGHDRPDGLDRALADAGFEDLFGLETFLAIEASAAAKLVVERTQEVDVRRVGTEAELAGYAGVLRKAFGEEDWTTDDFYLPRLHDPTLVLLVAYVDGKPAATGRLETPKGTPFAVLVMAASSRDTEGQASIGLSWPIAPPKPSGGAALPPCQRLGAQPADTGATRLRAADDQAVWRLKALSPR